MKKLLALMLALTTTVTAASATLYPRNTQFAEMKDGWYATVDFDYLDYDRAPGGGSIDLDSMTLPKVDVRYTFDERYRIGLNLPLVYGSSEAGTADTSAFGFGKLGLTMEAQIADRVNVFFNQEFPWTHSGLLTLPGPATGFDSYSFTTGVNIQRNLSDEITWFSELSYRYDDLDGAGVIGSFIYNNAFVWDTDSWFNPSLELTGRSTYGDEIEYTDLRIIPGVITPIGDDDSKQFRVSMPIGLNTDSPDIGVQAGFYAEL